MTRESRKNGYLMCLGDPAGFRMLSCLGSQLRYYLFVQLHRLRFRVMCSRLDWARRWIMFLSRRRFREGVMVMCR